MTTTAPRTNATPSLTNEERTAIIGILRPADDLLSRELPKTIRQLNDEHARFLAGKVQSHTSGYLLVKHGLESLLARGDGEEMEGLKRAIFPPHPDVVEARKHYTKEDVREVHDFIRRFFERIYWEIYRDDPTFRPEVIATDLETLKNDHGIL